MVENEVFYEIFYDTWKVPVGVFGRKGELVKLYATAGKRLLGLYLKSAAYILEREKKSDCPVLRLDESGSAWGVVSVDDRTVLFGPVQTGRNPLFPYDGIPEYAWPELSKLFRTFARALKGKDAPVLEKNRDFIREKAADRMFRTHREKNELDSMDDVFECVRLGNTQQLLRTMEEKKHRDYLTSVMTDTGNARTVFLFNLSKSYHTALEVCPVISDLVPLVQQYLSEMPKYQSIAAFQSGIGRMLYDFTRYVEQYTDRKYSTVTEKALKYIKENIYADISVSEIADHCAVSISALQHRFKKEAGFSVTEMILNYKTERACYFLKYTEIPCGDIAFKMGYCSQSYFIRQFRKVMGVTPMEYRRGLISS